MRKSKAEIRELSNVLLVDYFDTITTMFVHESNSNRGLTKATANTYDAVYAELLNRLDRSEG